MALTRDSRHKRRATGGKRHPHQKKRKYEIHRPAANTKMGPARIHRVRARGGNTKFRAIRLDAGNFSWGSEKVTKKTRILDVVYNASNNELVRTKTLVKGAVVQIDATPFHAWHKTKYRQALKKGDKGQAVVKEEYKEADFAVGKDGKLCSAERKVAARQKAREIDPKIEEQLPSGRLYAILSSRPGQSGRADGYVLEGPELTFYQKKINEKKGKSAK